MNKTPFSVLRKTSFLFVLSFLTLLFSCKKEGELSPNFDNGNLAISYVDTFSIVSSLEREDSLRTDGLLLNMLGLYHDPIFGPASSSIYTQVQLTGVDLDFDANNSFVDSVVLTLDYAGLHGDTASAMDINVYELDTVLDFSTDYYSNHFARVKPAAIGSLNFVPNLADSVHIDFDTIVRKPHLRVKLNNTFGDNILNATTAQISDNTAFNDFMKGLYLTTSETVDNTTLGSGTGSIALFDMNSELSTLTIYYDDTSSYSFTINSSTEKYSRFDQNYTGTDVEKHLNNDVSKDITLSYVSSMAGVKTKIELPTIQDLYSNGPIIINKAEIIFSAASGSNTYPDNIDETLYLLGIDANGNQVVLPDGNFNLETDPSHFDGTYNSATESYSFNITRHLHAILTNPSSDYGMYLVSSSAKTEPNRAVIGSGDQTGGYKMKLEITYSKI